MDDVPSWLKAMLHKRIDMINQHMHVHPVHQAAWKRADILFGELRSSLSEEQNRRFIEWEECMSLQVSKEKEEMYVRGLWDGFQLYANMDESLRSMVASECQTESNG